MNSPQVRAGSRTFLLRKSVVSMGYGVTVQHRTHGPVWLYQRQGLLKVFGRMGGA